MKGISFLALLAFWPVLGVAWPGPESRRPREVPPELISPFGTGLTLRMDEAGSAPLQAWQVAEAVRERGLQGVVVGPARSVAIVAGRVYRPGDSLALEAASGARAVLHVRLADVDAAGIVAEGGVGSFDRAVQARVEVPARPTP